MCVSILGLFPPCSEMLNSDEERAVGGVNERGRRGKRLDLVSACGRDKLHSEWVDSLLKYA